jgi:hypothetical protein
MSPETDKKLDRVRKYSASLRRLFQLITAVVAIGAVIELALLFADRGVNATIDIGPLRFVGDAITPSVRLIAAVGLVLLFGIALKLLHHIAALFGLYAKGDIFTAENVRQIRQIGISAFSFLAVWIYSLIADLYLTLTGAGAAAAEGGDATIAIGLAEPFHAALAGIVIIIVSWIMDVGRELREEQDLTV